MLALRGILLLLVRLCSSQAVPPTGCTLKSPLPSGVVCGVVGHSPVYAIEKPSYKQYKQRTPTFAQCRDLCLRRVKGSGPRGCESFRYNHKTLSCYYTPKPLVSVTEDPRSTQIFYNRSCFNCPPNCPPKIGVNLFDNGGFEMSQHLLAPWSYGTRSTGSHIVKGGAYGNSSKAHECKYPDDFCTLVQDFVSCPGTIYQFSFDYRAAPRGADPYYAELQLDKGFSFIHNPKENTATTWHTYKNLVTFDQGRNVFAYSTGLQQTSAIAEADNFQIIPTPYTFDAAPGATNAFANGDFETGSQAPWDTPYCGNKQCTVVSPGIGSAHAFQFSYGAGNSNPSCLLVQNFTDSTKLGPGIPYVLSLDFASNVPDLILYVTYEIGPQRVGRNTKMSYIYQSIEQGFDGPNGSAQMALMGQEDANYMSLSLHSVGTPPESGGILKLDNISVKKLASPPSNIA